jgi:hypothetical protein
MGMHDCVDVGTLIIDPRVKLPAWAYGAVGKNIDAIMIELNDVVYSHLTQCTIEAVNPELVTSWIA